MGRHKVRNVPKDKDCGEPRASPWYHVVSQIRFPDGGTSWHDIPTTKGRDQGERYILIYHGEIF
ncbi:MAG: hypothetical protein ACQEQO_06495 [Thermodesulfobacteriota bacterium]